MKSMAMGTGMARMRSERKMAAPLSTPTRRGFRPAYSRPIARPSSPTRAAISVARDQDATGVAWRHGRARQLAVTQVATGTRARTRWASCSASSRERAPPTRTR